MVRSRKERKCFTLYKLSIDIGMKVSWLEKSFHPFLGGEPCWVFSFSEESTEESRDSVMYTVRGSVCAVPIIDRPGRCVSSYVFSGQV